MQVKKQQIEPDMEQWTGSKLRKDYVKAVYCHFAYFNLYAGYIMRNAWLDEAQDGIKIARRNINNLVYGSWHYPCGRKQSRAKESLDEDRRVKSWLKTQRSEN